jgi:hypothetical protein
VRVPDFTEEQRGDLELFQSIAKDAYGVLKDFECSHARMYIELGFFPGTRMLRLEVGSECNICAEDQKAAIPVVARIVLRRKAEILAHGISIPRGLSKFED